MEVGAAEDRELEQAPRPAHRRVGGGGRVGGDRAEHRHAKVDRENEQEPGESERREPLVPHGYEPHACRVDPEGRERGDRKACDRHHALRDARRLQAGDEAPDRLVAAEVRAEREKARHERGEAEHERQPAAPADRDEPDDSGASASQPSPALLHADPTARRTKSESSAEYRSTCANDRPVPIEPEIAQRSTARPATSAAAAPVPAFHHSARGSRAHA